MTSLRNTIRCENCGNISASPAAKVNPQNYTLRKRMLCARCRTKLGWSKPYQRLLTDRRFR